ncbi:MAG: hypothetical protein NC253_15535, partial [Ruminococcus sp.]|nr:hypothetical protein [Ruminococcus sp.]
MTIVTQNEIFYLNTRINSFRLYTCKNETDNISDNSCECSLMCDVFGMNQEKLNFKIANLSASTEKEL